MQRTNKLHTFSFSILIATIMVCGFFLTASCASEKKSAAPSGDTTIVEVNGIKLTRAAVDVDINAQLAVMSKQIPPDQMEKFKPQMEQYKTKMEEALIEKFVVSTLFDQEAKKLKISITDTEVSSKIKEMEKTLPKGMTLENALKMSGATIEKLQEQLKSSLLAEKVIDSQVKSGPVPSQDEIKQYFNENKKKFKEDESIHASHILIKTGKDDDDKAKADKKKKIDGLHKQLIAGGNFEKLAKENSECPSSAKGGDLGTFSRGRMVKPFEEAAFSQKAGEIGPVIETRFGYHIIKVLEHKQANEKTLDQVKESIIKTLTGKQKRGAVDKYIASLKSKATIVYAASTAAPQG
ncbi:MAG: hypothetical protein GY868_03335 [Deltaproteobacteria bacterium]|nr:hypothetical protein [Deltaproteobacteria bacterium]